ncbi:hypothetical protein Hdeb2414_s0012g00395511 [Helianthus debilis subsp. tardiflorus]
MQMSPEEVVDVAGPTLLEDPPARPPGSRPDRRAPGQTAGLMLKQIYVLNQPGMCSGSRPDRFDRPARSGFENLALKFKKGSIYLDTLSAYLDTLCLV